VPARPFGSTAKYREKCLERWERQRPPGARAEGAAGWWSGSDFMRNRELLREHLVKLFEEERH
jgi:hypothetical protein